MTVVQLKPRVEKFRTVEETKRPFRIWDAGEKKELAHRCYSDQRRALDSALLLVRWSKVGVSLEIFDIRTAKWLGTYSRKVNSITFDRG